MLSLEADAKSMGHSWGQLILSKADSVKITGHVMVIFGNGHDLNARPIKRVVRLHVGPFCENIAELTLRAT
nr:hypothetical protein BaRGS_003710 [Batillaria attramentaria]